MPCRTTQVYPNLVPKFWFVVGTMLRPWYKAGGAAKWQPFKRQLVTTLVESILLKTTEVNDLPKLEATQR